MKTINVNEDVWRLLMKMKLEREKRNINDVIKELLERRRL